MFRAIITEKETEIQGTTSEIITGLACYVSILKNNRVPEFLIKEAIKIGLGNNESIKEEPNIEIRHKGDKIKLEKMLEDKEIEVLEKFLDIIKDSLKD